MHWLEDILKQKNMSVEQLSKLTQMPYNKLQTLIDNDIPFKMINQEFTYHIIHTLKLDIDVLYKKYWEGDKMEPKSKAPIKCPKCGADMVVRQSCHDRPFWGCKNYGKTGCKGTRRIEFETKKED